jgi:hypothetical protein
MMKEKTYSDKMAIIPIIAPILFALGCFIIFSSLVPFWYQVPS